jgi:hypothetical protein
MAILRLHPTFQYIHSGVCPEFEWENALGQPRPSPINQHNEVTRHSGKLS